MSNDQYYGGQPYDPYANGTGNGHQGHQGHQEQQGPDVAQTWEGQTWDTQFQPAVTYDQVQADRAQAAQAQQGYPQQSHQPHQPQQQSYEAYAPSQGSYESYGTPAAYYPEQPQPQQHQPQPQDQHRHQPAAAVPVVAPAPAPVAGTAPTAPAPSAEAGPGWSSPTTSGNTRITDAQRARAEGRSPIIAPGMQPAALTAVLGLLLAGGAALGTYGLLVPLVLLQGLTAAGWFRLNGMWPARQGIALAFAGGLAADAALLVTGRENAAAAIFGTLGVWVLLCLVLQLRSHADPDERMYGLMATIASAALTVVATGHLGAEPDAVVVGGVAVAAAVLARALPLPGPVSLIAALLASAGAGIAAGGLTGVGSSGALLGLGAGVCALVGLRVASYDYPSRFVHMTAGVALPLTAAAPAVYLLGRALV
ncbi:hypothetical protein J3A78_004162 [Streptomyces sp. PvR006]|uniref:hypothetical protein n=1 Tax=Streptomyces sp. PvR006 TaxID=2817860 RepID=UPI001AEB6A7F|nr:hypothetical protein [Streptomyces sp. PvR006]MBP2583684.1 hypothetical protein [Streptomyces sp. PvR006]